MYRNLRLSPGIITAMVIVGLLGCTRTNTIEVGQERQRLLLDFDWKFALGDQENAQAIAFDDGEWRELDLPHDWSIEGPFLEDAPTGGRGGYLPTGVGWYRKHFTLPEGTAGSTVWIEFDGVYMNSDVWLNGQHLGNYPFGYNSFHYDLTFNLVAGENVLAVRVDNSRQPNTRWYSGSGIYRKTCGSTSSIPST